MENEENLSFPCQNNTNYLFDYIMNIIFIIGALIISFIYYITTLRYIHANMSTKSLITYWFDYILISTSSLLVLLFYLIQQIQYIITEGFNKQCFLCNENKLICYSIYYSSVFVMLLFSSIIICDIIKCFILTSTINQVTILPNRNKEETIARLKRISIKKTIEMKYHIRELLTTGIILMIILITHLILYFTDVLADKTDFMKWFFKVYRVLYLIIIVILVVVSIRLKYMKRALMQNNFYSNNIMLQRIYNGNSSKLAYYTDFLSFKTTLDCIGNIPILLYITIEKIQIFHLIITYISLFTYFFFTSVIYIYIDKPNKTNKSSFLKKLFCLRKFQIHFGEKEKEILFEEFNFDYSAKEIQTLTDLNVTYTSNNNAYEQQLFPTSSENNNHVIYFILFKVLYLFFQNNEPLYTGIQKKMEEEGSAFMTVNNKPNHKNHNDNSNSNNKISIKDKDKDREIMMNRYSRLSRVSRISCLPKINDMRLNTVFRFNIEEVMNTLEEKEFKREFRHEYKSYLSSNNKLENDIEFKIESLFNSNLFPLFPFYQLTAQDLLRSLDPSNNKELFHLFKENVDKDRHYNEFYTNDSFLFFEVYEKSFLAYDKLKDFFISYQEYFLDVIKNLNYTYLPLIIGVYHISFLNFNKIVILYRHQLSFSPFVKFNNWIKFLITETPEETIVSQRYTDIIDVNEIEIKNNIKLDIEEYNEVSRNVLNDLNFIKQLPFKVYPKLNLFVGNQISNQKLSESNTDSFQIGKDDFDDVLRDTIYFGDNNNDKMIQPTKEFGSEIGSLFEKEYEIKGNEGRFVIKIFFSMLFRETCLMNSKEKNPKYKLEPGYYCDHIGQKLLAYLEKRDALFSMDDEDNSNDNKKNNVCAKSNELK